MIKQVSQDTIVSRQSIPTIANASTLLYILNWRWEHAISRHLCSYTFIEWQLD